MLSLHLQMFFVNLTVGQPPPRVATIVSVQDYTRASDRLTARLPFNEISRGSAASAGISMAALNAIYVWHAMAAQPSFRSFQLGLNQE